MIIICDVDTLPPYIKDMHYAAVCGLGVETTSEGDRASIQQFLVEDNDRVAYADLVEAVDVFLVYMRKKEAK